MPRMADEELRENLETFGAVVITGPKWCGKTTTAQQIAKSSIYLQDEDHRKEYEDALKVRPSMLLEGEKPRLIDEWQMAPDLWNTVRMSVDNIGKEGQYILTGSSAAGKRKKDHSGTGRITEMRMYTMSLFESGISTGEVSLSGMLHNKEVSGQSKLNLEDIAEQIVRGGWPSSYGKSTKIACRQVAGYCESILKTGIRTDGTDEEVENKEVKRNPERMRAVLRSLSRNTATATPDTTILKDINDKGDEISINTLRDYIKALEKIFVVDNLQAWNPKLRSKATVRKTDTRHLCDPAIAAYFLNSSAKDLISDLNTFGFLFESLVIRDLRAYSGPLGAEVLHYHDSDGLEADAIVHLRHSGEWGAIEVKLGQGMVDKAAKNLIKIRNKVDSDGPSFLAVVTGTEYAYTREDGVHVVPLGSLGP